MNGCYFYQKEGFIMDEALIQKIDSNNTKAKEILKGMLALMDEQNETIYFPALVEAALNFLETNSNIFSQHI